MMLPEPGSPKKLVPLRRAHYALLKRGRAWVPGASICLEHTWWENAKIFQKEMGARDALHSQSQRDRLWKLKKKTIKQNPSPIPLFFTLCQIIDKYVVPPGNLQAPIPESEERERRWPWQWRTTGEITNAVHNLKSLGINILHTWFGWREETDVVLQGMRRTDVFFLSGKEQVKMHSPLGSPF